MLDRIFSILSAQWLIHRDTAISYLPALLAFVNGQKILLEMPEKPKPYALASGPGQTISLVSRPWRFEDADLPENSVAVIGIDGVILSWYSMELINQLKMVQANDRINSVLLVVNSPGGMVSGVDLLANTIRDLGKPVVAMVMGMSCSAAVWAMSGATLRIATSPVDMIGSIGTKTSIQDFSGLFEKLGIKMTDFYATKATRKDEEERAFLSNNDPKPMQDFVDFVNEVFHTAIQKNMRITADSEVFTGAVFFAERAKELGLINEINSMDYALTQAYQLGLKNKIITQTKQLKF